MDSYIEGAVRSLEIIYHRFSHFCTLDLVYDRHDQYEC